MSIEIILFLFVLKQQSINMTGDKEYYKKRLERARYQRLMGLKNAFATIDCFAVHSLSPELYAKYKEVKKSLLINYSKT